MKATRIRACLVAAVLLTVGCGLVSSGTWEDSPKNWKRAFFSRQPKDVEVVHSKYWRSPHFTYEFQYFFQIRSNDTFRAHLFFQNTLAPCADSKETIKDSFFGERPAWFIPKPIGCYEVWTYRAEPRGNFKLFIDRETGDLFLTDYQV